MAHSPTPAETATKRAPSRSSRSEKPSNGSSWLVCTAAASPVASTSAASAKLHAQAADGQGNREAHPGPGRRHGSRYGCGQAEQGRGDQKVAPHLPDRVRNAAMMASGSGGQPGISTSTGTMSATEPATP